MTKKEIKALEKEALTFDNSILGDKFKGLPYRTEPYYSFLYLLAKAMKPETIIELGTYYGTSCMAMSKGAPKSRIYTVDVREEIRRITKDHVMNATFIIGDSVESSVKVPKKCDIMFIDTVHEYEQVKKEYEHYKSRVNKGGVVVFDDITKNAGMVKFWNEIEEKKVELNKLHWTGFGAVLM